MFHDSFNTLPPVTNGLTYALPYYNKQFLQNSAHNIFLCNIRWTAVHVTIYLERNKYIFVPFSTCHYALPAIL